MLIYTLALSALLAVEAFEPWFQGQQLQPQLLQLSLSPNALENAIPLRHIHALVSIEITIINKIYFRSIFQIYFMQYIVLFIIRLFSFLNPSHPYITVSREYSLDTVERPLH